MSLSVEQQIMYALLALDSYNRGYNPGLTGLAGEGNNIGNATVKKDATQLLDPGEAQAAGFYAVTYNWNGETIISYRGTDILATPPWSDEPGGDIWNGYGTGVGSSFNDQVHLAADFYQAVTNTDTSDPRAGSATLVGHSLGGGLAGFIGALYEEQAVVFANAPFEAAASDAYTRASSWIPSPTDLIAQLLWQDFYNEETPWAPLISTNLQGYAVTGEFLTPFRGIQSTPVTYYDSNAFLQSPFGLHSQALLTTLIFGQGYGHLDWAGIGPSLINALFNDEVGTKSGFAGKDTNGHYSSAGKMLAAIAYSALDGSSGLVFGNTGIRALFDDADELGKLVSEGKVPTAHANPIPGLSEAIVQFAGQMALGKVNYNQHMDWNPQTGFLSTYDSQGVTYLKADLAKELWALNDPGGENLDQDVDIQGIQTILNEFFSQEEEAALILAAMNTLYGSNEHSTIDRIDFALGSGALTVELPDRGDAVGPPPPYNPTKTSLFVALNGDDQVEGNSDNNMLVGGAGDDTLYGRLGRDIILGGTGSDRIIDLVHEVGTDGRTNESDVYFGEPSDQSLLANFFAWLLGTQSEDTVEYRLTDERQASTPPAQGLEITTLEVTESFDQDVVALAIKDLNSGKTGIDYLVNIDKVILSERRDEVIVQPDWLDVPLWIDLGKAQGGSVTKSDYDLVSYQSLGQGIVTVNGATQPGSGNGPVTGVSYLKLLVDLIASALDVPAPVTPVLSAFTANDHLRITGAEHVELTNQDDTLWYGDIGGVTGFLTGWPEGDDYPHFGIIDGKGGHDILVVRNAEYIHAGEKVHPEDPNSAVAAQDLNLEVLGGTGSDRVMVIGGEGAEVIGGPGMDFLFNASYKGKLYGGGKDGTGDDETDVFWWSSNSFIMDAGKNDILQMYGVPLTGGTNSLFGFESYSSKVAIDWLLPFVSYGATDSGQLLIFTPWSDGPMAVENYEYGGFRDETFGIPERGDLGMLFRIVGVDDLEVRLFFTVWGQIITFIDALWTFAKGLAWKPADDPLVLDLDGDGIETSTFNQGGVYFDMDADFFSEKTGWVGADDGFLVWDRDGNRKIEDSTELFGSPGVGGFAELSELDDNIDGVVDASDAAFSSLEVWRDLNQDGRTDPGELFSLADLDITSFGVVGTEFNHTTPNGNLLREQATFTRGDGSTGAIYEAVFETDQIDTKFRGDRGLADWVEQAPGGPINSRAHGKLADLAIHASNDVAVHQAVEDAAAAMVNGDLRELRNLAEPVVNAWTASLERTAELTPVLVRTTVDGVELADSAVYVEDATGGYWELTSGADVLAGDGSVIARPQMADILGQSVGTNEIWRVEQMFSPTSRHTPLEHREERPYLVDLIADRAVVVDYGIAVTDAQGTYWQLASGTPIVDGTGGTIACPTIDDVKAQVVHAGQEWRTESFGHDAFAGLPFDQMAVFLVDGIVTNYSIYVEDELGGFHVWADNVDRALELQHKEGRPAIFGLRNYEIDLQALSEAETTDDSFYRAEVLSLGEFRYATAVYGVEFQPEILYTTVNADTGFLEYSSGGDQSAAPPSEVTGYVSVIEPAIEFFDLLIQQYLLFSRGVAVRLAAQGGLKEYFRGIEYDTEGDAWVPTGGRELVPMYEAIFEDAPVTRELTVEYLTQWNDILQVVYADYQQETNDLFTEEFLFQNIVAAYENVPLDAEIKKVAQIFGVNEERILLHAPTDTLVEGTKGNDLIYLIEGDQTFKGTYGSDTYVVGKNFGHDTIQDIEEPLKPRSPEFLRFAHVASDQVYATRDGHDLVLEILDAAGAKTGDVLTIKDQFDGKWIGLFGIDWTPDTEMVSIFFADGVRWDALDIAFAVNHPLDTDDLVMGSPALDVLEGGLGNDILRGGRDSDYYVFNRGYGQDTIDDSADNIFGDNFDLLKFGPGIDINDLRFVRIGSSENLVIQILEDDGTFSPLDGDQVTIVNQFDSTNTVLFGVHWFDRIERLIFDDDSFLSEEDIMERTVAAAKTDGEDAIYGFHYEDTLDGGAGDDFLVGGDKSDVYIYGRDYGHDVIEDNLTDFFTPSYDILQLTEGFTPAGFDLLRDGASPTITLAVKGLEADQLTLKNQFKLTSTVLFGDYYFDNVDELRFSDGTVWDMDALGRVLLAQARTDGDDVIYGFDKNDVLDGGLGHDRLEGGIYSDTYIYQVGYGNDVIYDYSGELFLAPGWDTLDMQGIAFGDITVSRNITYQNDAAHAEDLIFTITATGETLTLEHQYNRFDNQGNAIENLVFSDQTILYTNLNPEDVDLIGTNQGENLWGTYFGELIDGRGGDDRMEGSSGGDTYLFDVGYGHDVIFDRIDSGLWKGDDRVLFGAGITIDNIIFTKDGNDLLISITDRTDTLRIQGQFDSTLTGIEQFEFADGTVWDLFDIAQRFTISAGGFGDNIITGEPDQANVLDGRQGDDQLFGGAFSDTYAFGVNYDLDTITEWLDTSSDASAVDTVVFGALVEPDLLSVRREGTDLILSLFASGDELRIIDGLGDRQIERYEFADGTVWLLDDVKTAMLRPTDGTDRLIGFDDRDDVLDGQFGSDALEGGLGNDTYHFDIGYGADSILDTGGTDRIIFGDLIVPQMLQLYADVDHAVIRFDEFIEDSLVILDSLGSTDAARRVESFEFADGTIFTFDQIRQALIDQRRTEGDDIVTGYDDRDDILSGGQGYDELSGGGGNDFYRYEAGGGFDIIDDLGNSSDDQLEIVDYRSTDAQLRRAHPLQPDLVIAFGTSQDQIVIKGGLAESSASAIETVMFADGVVWTIADMRAQVLAGAASDGDDLITGFDVDDTIEGGRGDDQVDGQQGSDTYVFTRLDGRDILDDTGASGNLDVLQIRGYAPDDVIVTRPNSERNDLLLSFENTQDEILLRGLFNPSPGQGIEHIEFGDGTVWDRNLLIAQITAGGTDADDVITGTAASEVLIGRGGDDFLAGGDGSDTYVFARGDGHDVIDENGFDDLDVVRIEGYAPNEVLLSRALDVPADLVIRFTNGPDELRIINTLAGSRFHQIEQIQFTDGLDGAIGTVWTIADIKVQMLEGSDGDDMLVGFAGSDTLTGGLGNDRLEGGDGIDTYVFTRGDGQDVIKENGYFDTDVVRIVGYMPGEVLLSQAIAPSDTLVLQFVGTTDQLTIINTLDSSDYIDQVEQIEFDDGTVWTMTDVKALLLEAPTAGDDRIQGFDEADVLFGGAGNDTLLGLNGADTLTGGLGNDRLEGGDGIDTYVFTRGDGQDVIKENGYFDTDVVRIVGYMPGEVLLSQAIAPSDTLVLQFVGTTDQLTIINTLDSSDYIDQVEQIEFDDGTVWTMTDVKALLLEAPTAGDDRIQGFDEADVLFGGAGNDTLLGLNGADTLTGGLGNDRLEGGDGIDTYVFTRGDGQDVIKENGYFDTDVVRIVGYMPGEVLLSQAIAPSDALVLQFVGTTDQLTIINTLDSSDYIDQVEQIEFDDGTVWTMADVKAMLPTEPLYITINGTSADDILESTFENEILVGGNGNDTYVYTRGDGDNILEDLGLFGGAADRLILHGIDPSAITVNRFGGDAHLIIDESALGVGDGGQIVLRESLNPYVDRGIESIAFDDGTIWTGDDLRARSIDQIVTAGDDIITGFSTGDTYTTGAGEDIVFAEGGDDTLTLGTDNDVAYGGDGNDTYHYTRGDGDDILEDLSTSGVDRVVLHGIDPSAITVNRFGGDAHLIIDESALGVGDGGQIVLRESLNPYVDRGIESIAFDDGTIWTGDDLRARSIDQIVTAGDDIITGFSTGDTYTTGAGEDIVFAEGGDDTLTLGTDNDVAYGGDGNDTYHYTRGDGDDILEDLSTSGVDRVVLHGIDPSAITVNRFGGDAHLLIAESVLGAGDGGQILLRESLNPYFQRGIESIEFDDGTIWTGDDLRAQLLADTGTQNNEVITGFGTNDELIGNGGDDLLLGDAGDDTYVYTRGDGDDIIREDTFDGAADQLILHNIDPSDVVLREGLNNDVIVVIADSSPGSGDGGRITLKNSLVSSFNSGSESIEFSVDGTVWNQADFSAQILLSSITDGGDVINGTPAADHIEGGGGNDLIKGLAGADTYVFRRGDGRDTIEDNGGGLGDNIEIHGYATDEVLFQRLGATSNDLLIRFVDSSDSITVINGLEGTDADTIETVVLMDEGATFTLAEISDRLILDLATSGADLILGTGANDQLTGGAGPDVLDGGEGDDLYFYRADDGDDRIQDSGTSTGDHLRIEGYTEADLVSIKRSPPDGLDLVLIFTGEGDRLIVRNTLANDALGIETVEFANGVIWDLATLRERVVTTAGTSSDERIWGFDSDEILKGGPGSDWLHGGLGSDTYQYHKGDGADTIEDNGLNGMDRIVISGYVGAEATVNRFYKEDDGIVVTFAGGGHDSITILNTLFDNVEDSIEEIEFADGVIWTMADVVKLLANNAPVAEKDGFFSAVRGESMVISSSLLLQNDFDPDDDPLHVISVSNPQNGTVELDVNGNVLYTAADDFIGVTTFDYTVSDGHNGLTTATVYLRVRPPATAIDDYGFTVAEDTFLPIRVEALLSNDIDGDLLVVSQVLDADHGSVSLSTNGDISFIPDADYHGTVSFRYVANTPDGGRAEAMVFVEVTPVNDAPVAHNDGSYTVSENGSLTFSSSALVANDFDVDGDTLHVTSAVGNADLHVTLHANGIMTVTPTLYFFGTSTLSYTVSDGHGAADTGEVTVTVTPVNNAPELMDDSKVTDEDVPLFFSVDDLLANDVEHDGDPMTVTRVFSTTGARVTLLENGTINFEPHSNYFGLGGFSYEVTDGQGGFSTARVNVQVNPINDDPIARNEAYSDLNGLFLRGIENAPLVMAPLDLLANDGDIDSVALTIASVSNSTNGDVEINSEGMVVFTPDADYWGVASFHYVISDGDGGVDDAEVTMYVSPTSDAPPVGGDDWITIFEDVSGNFSIDALFANDTDVDNDPLSLVSIVPFSGAEAGKATVTVNADGTFSIVPALNYNGTATFWYTVTDHVDGSDSARLFLDVIAVNDAPTAAADVGTTSLDAPLIMRISDMLANDSDVDEDPEDYAALLQFVSAQLPSVGALSIYENEFIVLEIPDGYSGPANFDYTIRDQHGAQDDGTVIGTVFATHADTLVGTVRRDLLIGTELGERFEGLEGEDDLFGRGGDDVLVGGDSGDRINGGDGFDVTSFEGSNIGVRADLQSRLGQGGYAQGDVYSALEGFVGSDFSDELYGDGQVNRLEGAGGNDLLDGREGDDLLFGGDGHDTLIGGVGADVLDGGADADTADYSGSSEAVSLSLLNGTISGGDAEGDTLVSIENLTGTLLDDVLEGDDLDNVLRGGRGDDTLIGHAGNDVLSGGQGADILDGGAGLDSVAYTLSSQAVTVNLATSTVSGGDADGDTIQNFEHIYGSFHDDSLTGDSMDNLIRGGGGADTIVGGGGFDTADYRSSDLGVMVNLSTGLGTGGDAEGDSLVGISGLQGSFFDDALSGDENDNRFEGGFGRDILAGAAGSDQYFFGYESFEDTINEMGASLDVDQIVLASDVHVADVGLRRDGDDLVLELEQRDAFLINSVRVTNHFLGEEQGIEAIVFADGTVWDRTDMEAFSRTDRFNAVDDSVRWADEDVPYAITPDRLILNDTESSDPSLTLVSVQNGVNGTAVLELDGSVTFTGAQDFHGDAFFDYTVTDGSGRESTATVEVTVLPVNDTPFAADDGVFDGVEDTPLFISLATLFANDGDIDGDTLSIIEFGPLLDDEDNPILGGVLSLFGSFGGAQHTNGGVFFVPDHDHFGAAGFRYTVSDGNGETASANVELHFVAVNDAPRPGGDGATTRMGQTLVIPVSSLLSNDVDPENDPISFVSAESVENGTVTVEDVLINGVPTPSVVFVPMADFLGTATFSYTVTDDRGASAIGQAEVTVIPLNDPPNAINDSGLPELLGLEDQVLIIDPSVLLANDSDPNGDVLVVGRLDEYPENGEVAFTEDGMIAFTPRAHYNGEASFYYWADDGHGSEDRATVTLFFNPFNDAPEVKDDVIDGLEDLPLFLSAFELFSNDSDPEGDVIFFHDYELLGVLVDMFQNRQPLSHLVTESSMSVATTAQFFATLPDGDPLPDWLVFDEETLTFSGKLPEDLPTGLRVNLLANESGKETVTTLNLGTGFVTGEELLYSVSEEDLTVSTLAEFTATLSNGDMLPAWLTFDAQTRTFAGTPPEKYVGTLSITVLAIEDSIESRITFPLVVDSSFTIDPLVALSGFALTPSGDDLEFTRPTDFFGSMAVRYLAEDVKGAVSEDWATVVVNVLSRRELPTAINDLAVTDEGMPLSWSFADLLQNDFDDDGDAIQIISVGQATNGTVVVQGSEYSFTVPPEATVELITTNVTMSATLDTGDPLPGWLSFDRSNGIFSGVPPMDYPGTLPVTVTATDGVNTVITQHSLVADPTDFYSVSYIPNSEFNGNDSFSYTITDQSEGESIANVSITINPVHEPPVACTDSFDGIEDTPLVISIEDLLSNDTDLDGETIRFVSVGDPAQGTVVIDNGNVIYTPNLNFFGGDNFTYTITDDTDGEATGQVQLIIAPDNDAPIAVNDYYTGFEDQPVFVTPEQLLANDYDADGDDIFFEGIEIEGDHGRAIMLPDESFSLTPDADYTGEVRFTYQINDTRLGSPSSLIVDDVVVETYRTIIVDFAPVNDAPTGVNDTGYTIDEDTLLTLSISEVLGNDFDKDGHPLSFVSAFDPINGTVTVVGDSIQFTPTENYFGNGGYSYRIADPDGAEGTAQVFLNILPSNDFPMAINDMGLVSDEEVAIEIDPGVLLANDSDPDGDSITFDSFGNALGGTVSLTSTGTLLFTPNPDFFGAASFDYEVSDPEGLTNQATVSINFRPVNDAPRPVNDSRSGQEDQVLTIPVLSLLVNDQEVDGHSFQLTSVGNGLNGTVILDGLGNVLFTPTSNYYGAASFTYEVTDITGETSTATVDLQISSVNDAPIVENPLVDQVSDEDTPFSYVIPTNTFNDVEGDALSYSALLADGSTLPSWLVFYSLTQTFTGMPPQDFNGLLDITINASDGVLTTDATFNLTISPVNDAPYVLMPLSDRFINEDAAFSVLLQTGTFADVDGDLLTLSMALADGTPLPTWMSFDADALTLTGTPPLNLNGTYDLEVTANDGDYTTSDVFTFTVNPVNDAPTIALPLLDQTFDEDTLVSIELDHGTFADVDGDALMVSATLADGSALPSWLVFDGDSFTGIPPENSYGIEDIRITASDGMLDVTDTFLLEIASINDVPVAQDDLGFTTDYRTLLTIAAPDLLLNDSDVDGDSIFISAVTGSINTQVVLDANGDIAYTPERGFSGEDEFSYTLSDGELSTTASVSVTVGEDPNADFEFYGTPGEDAITGDLLDENQIFGEDGDDLLTGGDLNDDIDGGRDNDILYGLGGDDVLKGGWGDDSLYGGNGADSLLGGIGDDSLYGDNGDDSLTGGIGNDTLYGENGQDLIRGGAGNDVLWGGGGNDTFVFETGDGQDDIMDFAAGITKGKKITPQDQITLGIDGINTYDDLLGYAQETSEGVLFDFGNGDELFLRGTQLAALDSDSFSFF